MVRTDIDSVEVDVPDDFALLTQLMGRGQLRGRIVDGLLTFTVSGVDVGYSSEAPAAGSTLTTGLSWGAGAPGWLIERIWVRESTAGGGAKAVFAGTVDLV